MIWLVARGDFMAAASPAPYPISRRGSKLIVPVPPSGQVAVLPPPCIRCGAPADGKPVEKTLYWHNPAVYLAILAGVLIYVILALVLRKGIRVRVPLCAEHAKRRSIGITLAWVLPLVGIADAVILPQTNVDGGVVALITIVLILTGLVIWAIVANPIRPTLINEFQGEFTGFCPAYLQLVPEWVQPVVTVPSQQVSSQQVPPPPPPVS
jgi:hypothetical protein